MARFPETYCSQCGGEFGPGDEGFSRCADHAKDEVESDGWKDVERDGLPPCDGHTVFVGVNSAGFPACFNHVSDNGTCTMGTAESCTAQMSCLRWWKVLDRPTGPVHGPSADWNTDYHYPREAA